MTPLRVPSLETARLVLRGPVLEDAAESAALWADPRTALINAAEPCGSEEAWDRLLAQAGHWAVAGFGIWVVRTRQDGRYAGRVGFTTPSASALPAATPEAGWVIAPWARGRGFAAEAALAAMAWADARRAWTATMCRVGVDNAASLRVAARCGYREQARVTYRGRPAIRFVRARGG